MRALLVAVTLLVAGCDPVPGGASPATIATDAASWAMVTASASRRGEMEMVVVDAGDPEAAIARLCEGEAQAAVVIGRPAEAELDCGGRRASARPIGAVEMVVAAHPDNDWLTAVDAARLAKAATVTHRVARWSDLSPAFPARSLSLYCPEPDEAEWPLFVESLGSETLARQLDCLPLSCELIQDELARDPGALAWVSPATAEELGLSPRPSMDGRRRWRRELYLIVLEPQPALASWMAHVTLSS